MTFAERLADVRRQIQDACDACGRDASTVDLLAVSKTRTIDCVREAMAEGLTVFGENRVQELSGKADALRDSAARWHLIGSLQTKKAKDLLAVPGLELVHSLDRQKLAEALQQRFESAGQSLDVLIQIDETGDEAKHGVPASEVPALAAYVATDCPNLKIRGVMAMGPLTSDPTPVFTRVARAHSALADQLGHDLPVLSLGMTGDLREAVAAGSTMIRVGTGLFGPRS